MDNVELQPDVSEVLQEEASDYVQAIQVCVEDVKVPLKTQSLPRKLATSQTRTETTTVRRVLRADPYRASAVIISYDQDIRMAFNEASAQDDTTMARWPVDTPYTHTARTELWIKTVTGSSETSVITERWATGE